MHLKEFVILLNKNRLYMHFGEKILQVGAKHVFILQCLMYKSICRSFAVTLQHLGFTNYRLRTNGLCQCIF